MTTIPSPCPTCGWSSRAKTIGGIERSALTHRCNLAKVERRRQHAERLAAIDRTPKDCRCARARHQHGSRAAYVHDKCRCTPCSEATVTYEQNRVRSHAYGRWDNLVDASPARAHLASLVAAGMQQNAIARKVGTPTNRIALILYGKTNKDGVKVPLTRVTKEHAAAILAVRHELAGNYRVNGLGTSRRLQGLVFIGYGVKYLAGRLGCAEGNVYRLLTRQEMMSRRNVDRVADLYEELAMRPNRPTDPDEARLAQAARAYAISRHWVSPLAWEEDELDDPVARPVIPRDDKTGLDLVAIDRRMDGDRTVRLTKLEKVELVRQWLENGRTLADMAATTGLNSHRYVNDKSTPDLANAA